MLSLKWRRGIPGIAIVLCLMVTNGWAGNVGSKTKFIQVELSPSSYKPSLRGKHEKGHPLLLVTSGDLKICLGKTGNAFIEKDGDMGAEPEEMVPTDFTEIVPDKGCAVTFPRNPFELAVLSNEPNRIRKLEGKALLNPGELAKLDRNIRAAKVLPGIKFETTTGKVTTTITVGADKFKLSKADKFTAGNQDFTYAEFEYERDPEDHRIYRMAVVAIGEKISPLAQDVLEPYMLEVDNRFLLFVSQTIALDAPALIRIFGLKQSKFLEIDY